MLRNLPTVTQRVNGKVGIQTQQNGIGPRLSNVCLRYPPNNESFSAPSVVNTVSTGKTMGRESARNSQLSRRELQLLPLRTEGNCRRSWSSPYPPGAASEARLRPLHFWVWGRGGSETASCSLSPVSLNFWETLGVIWISSQENPPPSFTLATPWKWEGKVSLSQNEVLPGETSCPLRPTEVWPRALKKRARLLLPW